MSLSQLSLLLDKSIIVDRAKFFPEEAYQSAIDAFMGTIPIHNVLSVYKVGSTGVPGLSDIDLFLVMKDDSRDFVNRYSIRRLNKDFQYLFSHEGWLTDEKTFNSLKCWFPYFDLAHLYGKKIQPDGVEDDVSDQSLILLINYILTKVPSDFLLYSCLKGRLYERIMLAMINSLRHSVELFRQAGGDIKGGWRPFLDSFPTFRSKWFEMDIHEREQKLKGYVVDAIKISLEMIESVDSLICSRLEKDIKLSSRANLNFITRNRNLHFCREWNSNKAIEQAINSGGREFTYPLSFKVLLDAFYKSDGMVGQHVRSCMERGAVLKIPDSFASALERYVNTIEGYADFHLRKFKAPVSGYHALWAPHTQIPFKLQLDYAFNSLMGKLKCF